MTQYLDHVLKAVERIEEDYGVKVQDDLLSSIRAFLTALPPISFDDGSETGKLFLPNVEHEGLIKNDDGTYQIDAGFGVVLEWHYPSLVIKTFVVNFFQNDYQWDDITIWILDREQDIYHTFSGNMEDITFTKKMVKEWLDFVGHSS